MKPSAYFVNIARSRLVDYDALYEVLVSGAIAGAALDVFDDEPLPADSRWRSLDNVTMTTHFGGDTSRDEHHVGPHGGRRRSRIRGHRTRLKAVNAKDLGWL